MDFECWIADFEFEEGAVGCEEASDSSEGDGLRNLLWLRGLWGVGGGRIKGLIGGV